MKVEHMHNKIRYTLSNDNLQVDDKVYPIARGRVTDEGWILCDFEWEDYCSGFPDDPHTILDLHHSDYKPYEVRTDMGFSPIECYYKIVKKEHNVDVTKPGDIFRSYEWQIIKDENI